jgi:mono/diheme cytochrome c family protein
MSPFPDGRSAAAALSLAFALSFAGCGESGERPQPAPTPGEPPATTQPAPAPASAERSPPSAPSAPGGGDAGRGAAAYATYCASCHGARGDGDGPVAAALDPRPAKHSDGAIMNALSDEHLFRVIKEGGPAAGKSPLMAAWGGSLSDAQIRDVVAALRSPAARCAETDSRVGLLAHRIDATSDAGLAAAGWGTILRARRGRVCPRKRKQKESIWRDAGWQTARSRWAPSRPSCAKTS